MTVGKLIHGIAGALVVGVLGFGSTQALAAPRVADGAERCTSETHRICEENCVRRGFAGGFCKISPEGVTVCQCF